MCTSSAVYLYLCKPLVLRQESFWVVGNLVLLHFSKFFITLLILMSFDEFMIIKPFDLVVVVVFGLADC